ncbi:Ppx/GppA phosphatase family protein [Rapidithrix thailandica]|uniref:Ppx/GppA phosphatase family protein n=1 Tax=Rapidithrix thailandica TaxID=413964 RepID=A0AAW9RRB9_9BACT
MRIAVLDLGTNTFHLIIAERTQGEIRILQRESEFVWLGKGGIDKGIITPEAETRALQTLTRYKEIINLHRVDKIEGTATSAIRNARNGEEILRRIKEETGLKIRSIDGDEEAKLIYYGIDFSVPLDRHPALIMDIGGGSVEFILGNEEGILWKQSFEIGAQRLLSKFGNEDPMAPEDLDGLHEYVRQSLQPLLEQIKIVKPRRLIGSAGTFDTLKKIHVQAICGLPSVEDEELAYDIPVQDYQKIHQMFLTLPRQDRLQIPGMIVQRADVIVVASALLDFVLKQTGFQQFTIASGSLREGLVYKHLVLT